MDDTGPETAPRSDNPAAVSAKDRSTGGLRVQAVDFARRKRTSFDVVTSVVGVTAVAVASLVVEDIVPDHGRAHALRVLVAALLVGALALLVLVRGAALRAGGTLYYVRLLLPGMSDEHETSLRDHHRKEGYIDVRVLTRLLPRLPENGAVDWAPDVIKLSKALQASMNEDSTDSGFHVAPNALWPATMALGYEMFVWGRFTLDEVPLPSPADPARRSSVLSWDPDVPPSVDGYLTPRTLSGSASDRCTDPVVLVSIHATTSLWERPETQLFRGWRFVGLAGPESDSLVPATIGTEPGFAHPGAMAREAVRAMLEVLHGDSEVRIRLEGRVTKTIGLGIGWLLAHPARVFNHPKPADDAKRCPICADPWDRIDTFLYDVPTRELRPIRVHPAQRPLT